MKNLSITFIMALTLASCTGGGSGSSSKNKSDDVNGNLEALKSESLTTEDVSILVSNSWCQEQIEVDELGCKFESNTVVNFFEKNGKIYEFTSESNDVVLNPDYEYTEIDEETGERYSGKCGDIEYENASEPIELSQVENSRLFNFSISYDEYGMEFTGKFGISSISSEKIEVNLIFDDSEDFELENTGPQTFTNCNQ